MYRFLGLHFARWTFFLWPLRYLMRISLKPDDITAKTLREQTDGRQIIYILPRIYMLDVLVLNIVLKTIGVPRVRGEAMASRPRLASLLAVRPKKNLLRPDTKEPFIHALADLYKNDPRFKDKRIALVPVSIFWGHEVEKQNRHPWIRFLFPDERQANSFQKLLMLIMYLRSINVHFSKPIMPEEAGPPMSDASLAARRLARIIMIDFSQERVAALGPALYEFDELMVWMLRNPEIMKHVNDGDEKTVQKNKQKLTHYVKEISANYSVATIRRIEMALDFVWTRIFKGVRVRNFNAVADAAKGRQLLWMPCHRSHLDYLLLSYILFKKGLAAPHIAAGVNLAFWPAGPILRRGGAFFLRRSFSGNRLYAATFSQYVHYLLQRGFPVEFFHEGGRSRLGKLLVPKTGMLSMCITSALKRKAVHTTIVPVYFGYDKVMEDDSYARELSGAKKQQESIWKLFKSVRHLFRNFGRVDVVFGAPMHLDELWEKFVANDNADHPKSILELGGEHVDSRDPHVQKFVKFVSHRVNESINSVASASGGSLLTAALTAYPENQIDRGRLGRMIWLLHGLVEALSSEAKLGVTTSLSADLDQEAYMLERREGVAASEQVDDPMASNVFASPLPLGNTREKIVESIIQDGVMWQFISEDAYDKNKLRKKVEKEMSLWWYRGTIFHVLAIPGVVSAFLLCDHSVGRKPSFSDIVEAFDGIRKIWRDELWWPMEKSSDELVSACLRVLTTYKLIDFDGQNIVVKDTEAAQKTLEFLSNLVRPEIEVYGIQLALAQVQLETTGALERDTIIKHGAVVHAKAQEHNVALYPASLSKVYAQRTFEGFVHAGVFTIRSEGALGLNVPPDNIREFFRVDSWMPYLS